jgi:hypothetical protein
MIRKSKPWEQWEAEMADRLGLTRTISSGNKHFDPGDAVTRGRNDPFPLYADAKCTSANSFSVKAYELRQYTERAVEAGKRFIMPLRFWSPSNHHEDYVVIGFDDFQELLERARRP